MDTSYVTRVLLLTLRLGLLLVAAPPFAYMRVPVRVRLCLVLVLAVALGWLHEETQQISADAFMASAASELLLGATLAFGFQAAFGALMFAGRVLDVQAGFGLALVMDPATRGRAPMFGTILTLAAAMLFFAAGGHLELLRLLAVLLERFPLGQVHLWGGASAFTGFLTLTTSLALATVAATLVTLFLTDLAIAFLSRALPQMNALMLGLQVKAFASLVVLALSSGVIGPVTLRLMRSALEFLPHMESM